MRSPCRLIVLLLALLLSPAAAAAGDWELSGSVLGGLSLPFTTDLRMVDAPSITDLTATDVRLQSSSSYGARLTTWRRHALTEGVDVGVELDALRFSPDLKAPQRVGAEGILGGGVPPDGTIELQGKTQFRTQLLAVNLLARFPMSISDSYPSGRWFPFVGVGAGASITRARLGSGATDTSTEPLLQMLAGLQVALSSHLGLFVESKLTHASHSFTFGSTRQDVIFNTAHLLVGVTAHY